MTPSQTPACVLGALLNLAKLRIVIMVLVACAIGFVLPCRGEFPPTRFLWTLLGTALLSGGASALNCYMERETDSRMKRTCNRPLPTGVLSGSEALMFGSGLIVAGSSFLFACVNQLSGILGLTAVFVYLVVYTPAKRLTWLNTPIGAIPGAIPVLIGWASVRGQIDSAGWTLFAMLFLWQHVHFFPIAWLYREDYRHAGLRMLPVEEGDRGSKTFLLTILSACGLIPVSSLLYQSGSAGLAFNVCSLSFSLLLIVFGLRLYVRPSRRAARSLLIAGLLYLPLVLAAVVTDRWAAPLTAGLHDWWRLACRWT